MSRGLALSSLIVVLAFVGCLSPKVNVNVDADEVAGRAERAVSSALDKVDR